MRIVLLGAAGFIGTNLTIALAQNTAHKITVIDSNKKFFHPIAALHLNNVEVKQDPLDVETDFVCLLENQDIVYHLISTTVPGTSNRYIADEISQNVVMTSKMLDACVACRVKKIVFLSSGGAVYGPSAVCPIKENIETNPISSYGLQKIAIEKLLYLYGYLYGIDYRIIRLANPYGPYQRPNGVLGVVTTFTYKALKNEPIPVYGDGSIVRDFIVCIMGLKPSP